MVSAQEIRSLRDWLVGARVMVLGLGRSGLATVRLLRGIGSDVVIYDEKPPTELAASPAYVEAMELGAAMVPPGVTGEALLNGVGLVIQSPGVRIDHPAISMAIVSSIPVWGEIELAYNLMENDFVAVTGTNGKTTTTALLGACLKAAGVTCRVAGNIGLPLTSLVGEAAADELIVLEVSSYQAESIESFRPGTAVFLNLTPDHLERHYTMEGYLDAKLRLFENQTAEDSAILNMDDETVAGAARQMRSRVSGFSLQGPVENGFYLEDGSIIEAGPGRQPSLVGPARLKMPGRHNLANAMAVLAVCRSLGIEPAAVLPTIREFPGVEHRIEFVREREGVGFYNDSKATNPDSTIVALNSFEEPIVLIAGGLEKGVAWDEMVGLVSRRCAHVVLFGRDAGSIAAALEAAGFASYEIVDGLVAAVDAAAAAAGSGQVVLLSPACASFDMFRDFEDRGRQFKKAVMAL